MMEEREDLREIVIDLARDCAWEEIFKLLHKEFNYGAGLNVYPNDFKSFELGIKEENGE